MMMFVLTWGINWPLEAFLFRSLYHAYLQRSFVLGNIDPINIYTGHYLLQILLKVFLCLRQEKKVRLFGFSPFDVFSMLWLMCCSSSAEQEKKSLSATERILICCFQCENQEGTAQVTVKHTVPPGTQSRSHYIFSYMLYSTHLNEMQIFLWSTPTIVVSAKRQNAKAQVAVPYGKTQCFSAPMDGIAKEICAPNEINPVWNQESSVVPQESPQRTHDGGHRSYFHQCSLLCGQLVSVSVHEKTCPSNTTQVQLLYSCYIQTI